MTNNSYNMAFKKSHCIRNSVHKLTVVYNYSQSVCVDVDKNVTIIAHAARYSTIIIIIATNNNCLNNYAKVLSILPREA